MKRLFLVFAAALLWAALSPAPTSAGIWPFGHHSKVKSEEKPPKQHKEKTKRSWFHHEHHQRNTAGPLYTSGPKSIGWWHKTPGPAGAGS
jgi:hypothetical protein